MLQKIKQVKYTIYKGNDVNHAYLLYTCQGKSFVNGMLQMLLKKTTYFLHVIQILEILEKLGVGTHTSCVCHNTL